MDLQNGDLLKKNKILKLKRATRTVGVFFFRAEPIGNRAIKAKDCGT